MCSSSMGYVIQFEKLYFLYQYASLHKPCPLTLSHVGPRDRLVQWRKTSAASISPLKPASPASTNVTLDTAYVSLPYHPSSFWGGLTSSIGMGYYFQLQRVKYLLVKFPSTTTLTKVLTISLYIQCTQDGSVCWVFPGAENRTYCN